MSETTLVRPNRVRLAVLRAIGVLVLMASLVLPAIGAADALNIRQRIDNVDSFQTMDSPISEVMINAADTWVEVVRGDNPLGLGPIWLQRSCVLPSAGVPWFETTASGRIEVFAPELPRWEQAFRRCETWVHAYVDPQVTVRVWDGAQVHEVDPDLEQWVISPEGRVITTPR